MCIRDSTNTYSARAYLDSSTSSTTTTTPRVYNTSIVDALYSDPIGEGDIDNSLNYKIE